MTRSPNAGPNAVAVAVACLFAAGCQTSPLLEGAITPSDIRASPAAYDGKRVRVKGWLEWGFERHGITTRSPRERRRLPREVVLGECVTVDFRRRMWRRADELDRQQVVVEGVFDAKMLEQALLLGACSLDGIDVERVESIRPFAR